MCCSFVAPGAQDEGARGVLQGDVVDEGEDVGVEDEGEDGGEDEDEDDVRRLVFVFVFARSVDVIFFVFVLFCSSVTGQLCGLACC